MAQNTTRQSSQRQKGMVLFLLLVFLLSSSLSYGESSDEKRSRLQRIKQQIQNIFAKKRTAEKTEATLVRDLQKIEETLQRLQQERDRQKNILQQQSQELKRLEQNLTQLRQHAQSQNAALTKRLRAIYKMGAIGYLTPLLAISSYGNMQQQIKYLQLLSKNDRQLIHDAKQNIQQIAAQETLLREQQEENFRTKQEIEDQEARIDAQRVEKEQILQKIIRDKKQHLAMLKKLEDSAGELESFLKQLEEQELEYHPQPPQKPEPGQAVTFPPDAQTITQSYAKHFRSNKGKLLWPVEGNIITEYGLIRFDNTYTQYNGVDIQAGRGTPFYSVFKGTVKFADWFRDYGKLVIVDHGGQYYTLYAHADEILVKPGDIVETRQVLGKVGDTDSVKGAHLYFEVRVKGKPEDPQRWLAKVR